MALKATIFKIELSVADIDRGYYADHPLTIARHPSETDEADDGPRACICALRARATRVRPGLEQ
jgi:hypothetical protein